MTKKNDSEDDKDTMCGISKSTPLCLQRFGNVQVFTFFYSVVCMLMQTLTFYINSQVPNIEKQFGLNSAEAGALMSFNDIGFILCSFFISSLARYVHIPRFLFFCAILYGASGIVCSLPFFFDSSTSADYLGSTIGTAANASNAIKAIDSNVPTCVTNISATLNFSTCDSLKDEKTIYKTVSPGFRNVAFVFIAIGMIMQGIGKAPRTPFVTIYVDDNVEKRKTGFYIGIMVASAVFGPVLAYGLGGYFSKIFVTLENVDISPRDPRFIGAWWLGFLVFGAGTIFVAVPILFFPRRLKWSQKKYKEYRSETKSNKALITTKDKVKDRVLSYWRVAKNPIYLSILTTNCFAIIGSNGYMSFVSKYIQTQFNTTLWMANIIIAATNLTALSGGAFLGGLLTRKVKMVPRNAFGLLFTLFLIQIVTFCFGFFLGCNQPNIVGPESIHGSASLPLSNCSLSCGCSSDDFFPVCGSDGLSYHSPCYAGCPDYLQIGGTYTNCSCVDGGEVVAGLCDTNCKMLYPWAAVFFLCSLSSTMKIMLSVVTKIRCVDDKDKSTAMGLQSFLLSLLAYLPAPILLGSIVDSSCLVWQSSCAREGACLYYNIVDFRLKIHTFSLIFYVLATLSISYALLRTRNWKSWQANN